MSTSKNFIHFNFHNLATMQVEASAPTAPLLHDIFFPFITKNAATQPDIVVTGTIKEQRNASYGETEYEYTDTSLLIHDTGVQVLCRDGRFEVNGSRELLVSVLPLVDRVLVQKGAAMVHAATIEYRGHGINLPAWGGTGKTSTIAKLLKRPGYSFMGDDWAFLSEGGELMAFAKPMFIKPHHKPIYPHLFAAKKKPLVPVRFSRKLGKVTTMVHPMITQYPRLARATRKFSPEHMMVRPEAAFPEAQFSNGGPLGLTMFVERFAGDSVILSETTKEWMVSRIVGNFHAEVSKHSQELVVALAASGLVPIERYFEEKAAVVRSGLGDKPTYLLRVPQAFSPDKASDAIVYELERVMDQIGLLSGADAPPAMPTVDLRPELEAVGAS